MNTGTIESLTMEETGAAVRQLNAEIDNRSTGVINVNSLGTLTNNKSAANHKNAGQINLNNGNYSSAAMESFENSGNVAGPFSMGLAGGTATDSFTNTGTINVGGALTLSSFTSVFGTGTAGSNVTVVSSHVKPGLSPGVFNVNANYTQVLGGGSLTIEIGGNTAGNGSGFHDQLNVAGTVAIASNMQLNMTSFGGYSPVGGDSYVVINNDGADAVSGTFNGLAEGATISTNFLGSGETATITYQGGTGANDVVINVVDNTPPVAPSVPDLDARSDSGDSATDDLTNVVAPTFKGTAEPGSTVEAFSDVAGSLGTVAADATTGAWSIVSIVSLADGAHNITATATDAASNTSVASAALAVTIDTSVPVVSAPDLDAASDTGASNTDDVTSDNTPTLNGAAEPNASIEVFDGATSLGTTSADGSGNWSFTSPTLADGVRNLSATATDAAGNTSSASAALAVTVDTTAPAAPAEPDLSAASDSGVSNSDDVTADDTPSFSSTSEANAAIEVFDGVLSLGATTADGSGNWSFTSSSLADGIHSVSAKATDLAGNVSAASSALAVTIDTAAPGAPSEPDLDVGSDTGDSNTDDVTADNTPTFSGAAEANATVQVFDGATLLGSTTADGAGDWSLTSLPIADGIHNLSAIATDVAGNTGPVSTVLAVTIDTSTPAAPSEPDLEAASDTGSLDTDDLTADNTPTFIGTAEANSTVVVFDGATLLGSTTANAAGDWSFTALVLADGTHNISATAGDTAGNTSSASTVLAIVIDTNAPVAPGEPDLNAASDTGSSNTDDLTADNTPTFSGTSEAGATIEVFAGATSLGAKTADGSGNWAFTSGPLGDGVHDISAVATDAAGNTSTVSASLAVTIDTSAPAAPSMPDLDASSDTGISDTDNITSDTTPTLTGTAEPNSSVDLFDGATSLGTTTADGSGDWSFTTGALSDGLHNISATATDSAGNTGPASTAVAVTIDTSSPGAPSTPDLNSASDSGDSNADNLTNVTTPTFNGTAEAGSTVEVFSGVAGSLGAAIADGSGDWTLVSGVALDGGTHNITAAATDPAGNNSAVSGALAVTIDVVGPTVTVNQATGQADPAIASPINFAVVFSEATTTFDASDVTISGTAAGTLAAAVTGSGTTYNVAVSGMTGDGTVIVDVGAGVANDAAGNANSVSTSTDNVVTFQSSTVPCHFVRYEQCNVL